MLKTSKNHSEMMDWLKSDEGQESIQEYFGDLEQKRLSKVDFFESGDFNRIYSVIYEWIKVHGRIDETDVHYKFNENINIESEDFNKFTDCIEEKFQGQEIEDKESSFPKYHYVYKCFDVYFMHGQGTVCWINYNISNDRDEKINSIL